MAEAIPYATISNILFKLGSLAWQEFGLIFGLKKDLEKLRETLTTINSVLLDAEEKQESNHAVKNWIIRLEDVVYDADDLLDEFDFAIMRQKALAQRQVRKFFSSSNPLAFGLKMGHRIKEIRERLDIVTTDISKFNLSPRVVLLDKKAKNIDRETASKVRSELIVGREKDKEQIIDSLLQEQNDHHYDSISIVAIVGFGGLGKTLLAQLVFNDTTVKNFFDAQIWVCVSEEFEVLVIFRKILKSLVDERVDDLDLDKVQRKLEENLKGKRYLLVLDDVWNDNNSKWDNFSKYLVFGAPGSKILVTARSKNVASIMGIKVPYLLEGLNEDQSLTLFEQVAFEGQGQINSKLREIGVDVAQKCKGVPLAIKCLGGLMRQNPNEEYWSSVQENDVWKFVEEHGDIFPVLKLSYIHLPSHLKQCFTFCSIFPKDLKISKELLIQSWRAHGYIQDIDDKYFNDLLSRSFFQEEVKDGCGNIISYKMHDLIHDLALSVAKSDFHWMKDEKGKIPKGIRHVSIGRISEEVLALPKAKGIRTISVFSEPEKLKSLKIATLSKYNCLRMLNLSNMNIEVLPNSIGKLRHLRYLDLSRNRMELLPDAIGKLHKLQTLILHYCVRLKRLPIDIQELISLEYLDIDHCWSLECLPKGLGELTSLTRLGRFIVDRSETTVSTAATLNELRDLNNLGNHLRIERLDKVRNVELESEEAILKAKKRLQSLLLEWDGISGNDELLLDNLEPHPNLKELEVSEYPGAMFSSWLSALTNLVKLDLFEFLNCQYLPPFDHLLSLKSLTLVGFPFLEHLPPLDHLSSLQSLTIVSLEILENVADSFPLSCSTTTKPFFPSLEILWIEKCPNLKGWWRTKDEKQGSSVELPYFPCLSELHIDWCPLLTYMPLFPSLDQKLTLSDTSIRPFQQTLQMKMIEASITSEPSSSSSSSSTFHSSSSISLPLSNLKRLTLSFINDLDVPSKEFLHNLSSLTCLKFVSCDKLESLLSLKMNCLSSLLELEIFNCRNLSALPDWIPTLTSLRTLGIRVCPELQCFPEGMHRLTSLQALSIVECPQLSERCQKGTGIHWPHIAHIPSIEIDHQRIH